MFLMFWKKIIKDNYQANFCLFLIVFSFGQFGIKQLFKKRLYLGLMWEMGVMELTTGGPDIHDDPHETGAVRPAARPLLVQKNHFRKYQKLLHFWLS